MMTTVPFANLVRKIPDFPKPGIMFLDISPLLADPSALPALADALVEPFDLSQIDLFVGVESRGFILAAILAGHHNKGFVPLRKAGKLPPPVIQENYDLEYGQATLEIAAGKGRVLVVDDVLATGGTLQASINLCQAAGYHVQGCAVLIDLPRLNEFRYNGKPVHSVLRY